jgi:ParB-like chromosome segregation protein Spo0J
MIINTPADYLEWRDAMSPVYVTGKRKQQIHIPCANTLLVARELIEANTYNPNSVPDTKMELLRESIVDNGFAFPVVCIFDHDLERFVVIDGFHRFLISGPDWLNMSHVPVAVLSHDASQRMIATWQFNKARGHHQVDLDADLIRALLQQGMKDEEICQHLGISLETLYRYKQVTGIAELFKNVTYSMPWEMKEVEDEMAIR